MPSNWASSRAAAPPPACPLRSRGRSCCGSGSRRRSRASPPLKTKSSRSRAEEAIARRTAYRAKRLGHRHRALPCPSPATPGTPPGPLRTPSWASLISTRRRRPLGGLARIPSPPPNLPERPPEALVSASPPHSGPRDTPKSSAGFSAASNEYPPAGSFCSQRALTECHQDRAEPPPIRLSAVVPPHSIMCSPFHYFTGCCVYLNLPFTGCGDRSKLCSWKHNCRDSQQHR